MQGSYPVTMRRLFTVLFVVQSTLPCHCDMGCQIGESVRRFAGWPRSVATTPHRSAHCRPVARPFRRVLIVVNDALVSLLLPDQHHMLAKTNWKPPTQPTEPMLMPKSTHKYYEGAPVKVCRGQSWVITLDSWPAIDEYTQKFVVSSFFTVVLAKYQISFQLIPGRRVSQWQLLSCCPIVNSHSHTN